MKAAINPTLEDIRQSKNIARNKIKDALDEFHKKTGQNITSISLHTATIEDGIQMIISIDFETNIDQSTNL